METTRTLNTLNDTRTVTPNKYVWGEFTPDTEGVGYKELPTQTEIADMSTATLAVDVGGPTLVSISMDNLKKILGPILPPGVIFPMMANSVPNGWLLCDGQAVSRETYSDLFTAIGTTYGSGDGSSTFNLPDCRGLFLKGKEGTDTLGVENEAGLPNITGTFSAPTSRSISPTESGAFSGSAYGNEGEGDAGSYGRQVTLDASQSNSIYGNSTTVTPRNLPVNYIIKY